MNKIYKVIWSKTRNCYVAVSEIAKQNGKGSFVHKGKAALALAVSLWMTGGVLLVPGLASAANSGGIKVGDTYRGDNGTLENNEIVYDTNVDGVVHVVGAYATDANQTATNNTVTIDGNVNLGAGHVAGAWLRADNSRADGNTVIINSGTINDVYGGRALGGGTSRASGNTVTINGGTIKQMVAGGCFRNGGTAEGNTITLNGVTIGNGVYGGYNETNTGTLTGSGNILNLSGTNTVGGAVKNFETINFTNVTWGEPALTLTGTYTGDGISQNADGTYAAINTQSIVFSGDVPDAGTTTLISGTNALPAALKVYTGATTKATLTTSGVVVGSYKVTDGSDDKFYKNLSTVALANENKAVVYTVTDNHLSYTDKTGTAGAVTLYAQPSASDTDAGYTVAVNNYTLYLADGFKSLTVAGGDWDTLTELYAGYTTTGANLSGYSLSVTGTLNAPNVYSAVLSGAYGEKTTAATTISGNAVNIDHGTIDATGEYASIQLYGSWIRSKNSEAENGGSASDNSVNIDNGTLTAPDDITISGEKSAVAMAAVTDGSVMISDSVITSTNGYLTISGIENSNAGAARGSVTISGSRSNANSVPTTRLSARQIYIYAANAYTYESKQGSVSLSGDVGFKGNVSLYGKHNWATDGIGNTLHIGTDDVVWRGYTSTDGSTWTQTNAIGYVYNFDTIALHAVEFPADPDNAPPALKTTDLSYRSSGGSNDLSKVTLDLTNLSFVDGDGNAYTPTSGSMKLLDTATDLTGMKLSYDAATQTTPVGLTTSGVVVGSYKVTDGSDDKFYKNRKTVALANENKDVTYTISHLSYTDTANKAVTLYVQPSASDTEAGYTVTSYTDAFDIENKRLNLADDFNSLTIADGMWNTLTELYAGYSASGDVTGKTFSITGGTITKTVYGGYSQSGTAGGEGTDTDPYKNGNKVSISGGTVNYWVFGGCSDSGAARYNTIEISGGTITNMVYGGRGATDTTGNKVTITGGKFDPGEYSKIEIYGGFTDLEVGITSVAATGNAVTIEGGDFTNTAIYGGFTDGHNASGNAVTISTTINGALGAVYGGYVDNNSGTAGDSAAGNVVTINGGVVELVYGGLTQIGTAGGEGTTDDPYENGNKVTINGGEVTTVFGGSSNNGTAINNQVSITGGTVKANVYGGRGATDTTGNKVTIEGGKISSNLIYGGRSESGSANNNTVEISGGTFDNSYLTIYGGRSESGSANNNTVEISGGTFDNSYLTIYGGKGIEANNNTVEISVANFKAASICVGDGATSTGNTLVLGAKGVKIHDSESGIGVVGGVQTIALTDKVQFEDKTAVLKADKFAKDNKMTEEAANFDGMLDISAATGLQGATAPGVMTLLQSDTENNFTTLDLKYKDATGSEQTANLSGKTTSQIVWEGAAQEDEKNGVKLVYSNTHTVSVAAGGKTITYNIANPVGDITFGSIDWVKGGTARTLTAAEKALLTVNGTTAVNAADLTFTGTIHENPLNQSMTLLAGATGITGDHITQAGEGKGEIAVAYTDAKGIALNARAKGEVSVASGSVKYTINRVALDKATLGSLAWGDTDSLPESWQASGTTQIDDTNFAYTGTASTALKAGNTATILTAPGLLATSPVTVGTVEGKTVDVNYTDDAGVSYTATASGHVAAAKGAVNYVVDSVAATGVNLQSWNGKDASTAITTNGWTGTGVAVATGSFAAPTDLNLGETRTITAAPTGFFGTVTGSNAYPSNGGTLSEDTGGVKLAGSMIGGVKAEDDGTTATLTYYAMKKTADTMTLGTFAFADSDANARTYGKEYDLTNAEITTDGLAFTEDSKTTMETGNKMTLVDASGAYKNGGVALKALSSGAKTSFAVAFTDTIESKGITFAGTHTDTLTQDTTKTKLTYTVGDKNVSTATLSGDIAWSDGGVHYTNGNDANQNGTKASYKFDGNTAVNISGVSFSATADPLNQSMTLLKGVDGVAADKVSGTPAFTVTLDQTNTKLDAKATGAAAVSGNDVTYTVSGVTIDKVNVKSVGSIADTVPENWTLATGATIETNGMSTPTLDPGKHIDILQSNTDNFFANAKINGDNAYKASDFTEKEGAITFAGSQSKGVTLNTEKKHLIYAAGTKDVQTATLSGDITWSDGGVHYTNKQYTFSDASQIVFDKDAAFTATADPLNQSMTLIGADSAGHAVKGTVSGTPGFTVKMNNTSLDATVTGAASIDSGNLKYTVTGVTLNKVTVDSVGSDAVPEGWSTAVDVQVDTESMNVPTDAAYGQPQNIMTSDKPVFEDSNITGSNKYGETPAAFTDTDSKETPAVTVAGTQNAGVKASADKKSLVYEVGKKEATSVKLGTVTWAAGSQLMDGSNGEYDYSSVKSVDTGSFAVNYASPQTIDVSKNESMTLLQANDTLKAIVNEEKKQAYSYTPVTGVTMDANIIGRLTNNSGAVTYAPTANKAVSLIFGDVDWLDSGALIDHKTTLTNVSFDGAAVDTTKINFTNKEFMEADRQMTLVSDFGGKPGSITGSKYMVGTGFEGEGSASMEDGNLIFKTRTGAGVSEQTHKTVMAMEADVALLNAGSEHIDNVMTGLGDPANMGEDGTSTSASIGGGGSRYETGSHVSSHTWNAAVGIGRRRELDKGTLEYGIFGEYGKSSYTLHSDAGKGDGDSHHAGGGLLAKWTNKHDVYTEASFRLGRMSNSASNVLRDAAGNGFGYNVHATYCGAHVGVGKIFRYNGGRSLDVYGKFFYTKRNGVNFTAAAQQYDLDSVASSILRIGARYGTTDRKWNWYGGLAYEYEFDGEASGTVNGAAVRAASIKGGSGRAEIGMRMNATKTNPWQADISLYGYAGKHRGFGGNISVAYMF